MERIDATETELRPQYPESSATLMDEYYSQLNITQKVMIMKKLAEIWSFIAHSFHLK